jgi:hypothetical protein
MPRARVAVTLAVAALALGGCGASERSSVEGFQGAEREVAQVIADLQAAGQSNDAEEICGQILARELAQQIGAEGRTCAQEMDKATSDADEFDLQIRDVTISGSTARAQVREGDDGPTASFELAREAGGWRVTSLAA